MYNHKALLSTYCGSPLYASPEIVTGTPYHGPEVDCWYVINVVILLIFFIVMYVKAYKNNLIEGR